jgi:hypothetical protein
LSRMVELPPMLPLARPRTCILVLFPALRFGSDSLKDHLDVGTCEYKESGMWSRCRDVWRCGMSGVMMYNSRLCYSRPRTTLRLPQNAVARTRCFLEISVYPEIKSAVTLLHCVEITPANVVVQHCSRYHSLPNPVVLRLNLLSLQFNQSTFVLRSFSWSSLSRQLTIHYSSRKLMC